MRHAHPNQQHQQRMSTAKRLVSSLLENTHFVCGSIKDALSEKENVDRVKSMMACTNVGDGDHAQHSPVANDGFFEEDILDREDLLAREEDRRDGYEEEGSSARLRRGRRRDDARHDNHNNYNHHNSNNDSPYDTLTIGLCLSRRHPLGHPDTVTRQTSFDLDLLQDREYAFVSSTDSSGWLAGGGEKGGNKHSGANHDNDDNIPVKRSAVDTTHIPILTLDRVSPDKTDEIISALARGEVFIPQMSVLPEALSVDTHGSSSPPDLIVRFDCEKNEEAPPEEWPNWCLEFVHNQLYDLLSPDPDLNVRWTKRPFQITLAKKVKWKTVRHMNKYFANAETAVNGWRERGPQCLRPPPPDHDDNTNYGGGATREEMERPHGIYLLRNGIPTNYFCPNFEPPYTRKVTRSLIRNVVSQSWDAKRRDWLNEPIPRKMGPLKVVSDVFGCEGGGSRLSPIEGGGAAAGFDLTNGNTMESFDIIVQHHQGENSGHPQYNRAAAANSKGKSSPGRRGRKETIDNHVAAQDPVIADSSPSRRRGTAAPVRSKEPNVTNTVPSDESFHASPGPTETVSTEETVESTNECLLSQPSVESTAASSTQYSKSTTSRREERAEQELFSPALTPQRKASPKVQVTGTPKQQQQQRQVVREEKVPSQHQQQQPFVAAVNVKPAEQQLRNPFMKAEDTKAEKFAKTKSKRREMRDRRQDDNTPTSKSSPRTPKPLSPTETASMAGNSLAYSLEDSTYFRQSSSHVNHNDGGSVFTANTENQSLLSYVTRSTMVQSKIGSVPSNNDDDDISLSILESHSSIVPTDEELFQIGWAKALDANSGLYYYFTLDRSKTVWENPLSTSP